MEIEDVFRRLGINKNYKGCRRTSLLLELALENDCRLEAVTKELYMEAAEQLHCHWKALEHSLRTVIKRAWITNPEFIQEMAGYPMDDYPANSEFLSITVGYIQRSNSFSAQT